MFKLAIVTHPTVIAWEDMVKWIVIVGPFATRSHKLSEVDPLHDCGGSRHMIFVDLSTLSPEALECIQ
jgi:hypothetical protein